MSRSVSDHSDFSFDLPCSRTEAIPFCACDAVRADFADIAMLVARKLRRVDRDDPATETQFERCLALLVRAASCRAHPEPARTVPKRVRRAVGEYLTGPQSHRGTLRTEVVTVVHWATRDYGRYALAGTGYTSRPERKFAALTDGEGVALLSPVQVAAMTLLVRGVVAFGDRCAATIVLGIAEDAVAVSYLRDTTAAAYRSAISGNDAPVLLGIDTPALSREVARMRRRGLWRRGGAAALELFDALIGDAAGIMADSVERMRESTGHEATAAGAVHSAVFGSGTDELTLLLEIRDDGYRLPGGRVIDTAGRRAIDFRIDALIDLVA
ncbi:hypothetical protein OG225_07045 [Nocardia sp. NBC_01377]|uniref:hypothetical protein n=1 Tax=Nocardia sp. NBC_01377 TaxID=2903595 RepID=UPI003248F117